MISSLLPQHLVLISGTYALPPLRCFWNDLWTGLADEQSYKTNIDNMRLRLQELQEDNRKAQKLGQQRANNYKEIDDILHYQSLPFVPKAI